jgi:hypothetical protein
VAESKARLLERLRAWEAEREGDWHGMAYLADEAIAALRKEIEERWPILAHSGQFPGSGVSGG